MKFLGSILYHIDLSERIDWAYYEEASIECMYKKTGLGSSYQRKGTEVWAYQYLSFLTVF